MLCLHLASVWPGTWHMLVLQNRGLFSLDGLVSQVSIQHLPYARHSSRHWSTVMDLTPRSLQSSAERWVVDKQVNVSDEATKTQPRTLRSSSQENRSRRTRGEARRALQGRVGVRQPLRPASRARELCAGLTWPPCCLCSWVSAHGAFRVCGGLCF